MSPTTSCPRTRPPLIITPHGPLPSQLSLLAASCLGFASGTAGAEGPAVWSLGRFLEGRSPSPTQYSPGCFPLSPTPGLHLTSQLCASSQLLSSGLFGEQPRFRGSWRPPGERGASPRSRSELPRRRGAPHGGWDRARVSSPFLRHGKAEVRGWLSGVGQGAEEQ